MKKMKRKDRKISFIGKQSLLSGIFYMLHSYDREVVCGEGDIRQNLVNGLLRLCIIISTCTCIRDIVVQSWGWLKMILPCKC